MDTITRKDLLEGIITDIVVDDDDNICIIVKLKDNRVVLIRADGDFAGAHWLDFYIEGKDEN